MSRVLSLAAHPWSVVRDWVVFEYAPTPITACAFCHQTFADTDIVCAVPVTVGWVMAVVHDDCLDDPACLAAVHAKHDPRLEPWAFVYYRSAPTDTVSAGSRTP